jgi:predicted DNA-binding helix-hairpin-helix protein
VKQTTQFIVGAADEKDADLVKATFGLYRRLKLSRVYFSAYQRGLGEQRLPGECRDVGNPGDLLTREHRLYQADWLMRKYGFSDEEIPFEPDGNLSIQEDPKSAWARLNPQYFPLNVNKADKFELLRVPGLGPTSVNRILASRAHGGRISSLRDVSHLAPRLKAVKQYLTL